MSSWEQVKLVKLCLDPQSPHIHFLIIFKGEDPVPPFAERGKLVSPFKLTPTHPQSRWPSVWAFGPHQCTYILFSSFFSSFTYPITHWEPCTALHWFNSQWCIGSIDSIKFELPSALKMSWCSLKVPGSIPRRGL